MLIVKQNENKEGVITLTVRLSKGEKIRSFHEDVYYSLGDPVNDVMQGHILIGSKIVSWCPFEQKWV